jgi:mevalonate kinase
VEVLDTPELHIEAPDVKVENYKKPLSEIGQGDIPKGAQFVEIAVRNFLTTGSRIKSGITEDFGLRVTTSSEFSSQFGFGSSSASTVCVVKALSELFDLHLSNKELFDIAYKTVLDIQGKGSGFDIAAGIYGGTLFFVTGGEVIEPLVLDALPLIVGYSGVKADTVTLMNQVKEKSTKYPEVVEEIYNSIEDLVLLAKDAVLEQDFATVGDLMNINQGFLAALGVSTKKLADMIYSAREAGAYGAKLSGAGGGDCMIALAPGEKRDDVIAAIAASGGEVIDVKTHAEGVRIEK